MAIDFSGTEYENEELEPLVTTSLTREDDGLTKAQRRELKAARKAAAKGGK